MRIAAVICNVILFGFTCVVLRVDGLPNTAVYSIYTLWLLLTLLLSAAVISHGARASESTGATMRTVAIACNIVLLAFTCWAYVDQYPHPEEEGFLAFTVLMAVTPILSVVTLLRGGTGHSWIGLHPKRKPS